MNSKRCTRIIALTLFATLASPVLMAQAKTKQHHPHQYHHYQLIDPGTLGGPNCYNSDCFVSYAVVWQRGVLTDLGALDPGYSSFASAINARGEVAGLSEN